LRPSAAFICRSSRLRISGALIWGDDSLDGTGWYSIPTTFLVQPEDQLSNVYIVGPASGDGLNAWAGDNLRIITMNCDWIARRSTKMSSLIF
jgi:hypothetical protein